MSQPDYFKLACDIMRDYQENVNGDGPRERMVAALEIRLTQIAKDQDALARARQTILPILGELRMRILSVGVAQAMLADKGIEVRET